MKENKLTHLYDEQLEDESNEYLDKEYFSTTFPELIDHDLWQGENY